MFLDVNLLNILLFEKNLANRKPVDTFDVSEIQLNLFMENIYHLFKSAFTNLTGASPDFQTINRNHVLKSP